MANEETKTFNVFNKSVRLIHVGSVMIPPEKIVALVDDSEGINRESVETCEFLEFVSDEANFTQESKTPAAAPTKPKVIPKEGKSVSATGATWGSKK